ncbi:putative cysteine-rich receptor-like protein kinase 31 [Eucalyptus grandis]|uniref:putative cysteine-rich receptor-like protein kinase 31 n=1 Tax=Eucalyptus grandis TaxID=71139 RepID=UPI00192EF30F|nr:putative cysteine-rich receptor-like protein kinase 31 [Eucalyptus grandis]
MLLGNVGAKGLTTVESLQFDLATIQAATNYFSPENKLGEGGFGEVFQVRITYLSKTIKNALHVNCRLPNGQQIAVKRLSRRSRQGVEEFKNEILLVAKLQHRNLVRLLGFCLEGDEKLLAYEFVPNKSLDYFLFEYAMHGEFSLKSDVYSFGIILLEIVCGKKNNYYHQLDEGEYLTSYVWNQWRDGKPLEVLDPAIMDSYSRDGVLRCLHICLLCIQEDPTIRPTMATVVLMLSNNSFTLPSPQHPAFFVQSSLSGPSIQMEELKLNQSPRRTMPSSTNGMSVTELCPQ